MKELCILLVEDNPLDALLVREYLKKTNLAPLRLIKSESLAEGLAVIKSQQIDIILLDLFLPDCSGAETFVRMAPLSLVSPVVVLTALNDQAVALEALKYGAQDFVIKGEYDEKSLEKTIRYAIERKNNQELLKISEAKYKVMFESNPVPMWTYDIDSLRILTVNEAAISHYGYSKEEFLITTMMDICVIEGSELAEELSIRARGENGHTFLCLKKKDDVIIDVEMISHSIVTDSANAQLVVAYDITVRKKAEAHLHLLESVIINAQDAVMITDAKLTEGGPEIIYGNAAFAKMTGYPMEDMVGKNPLFLQGSKTDRSELDKIREAIARKVPISTELINYQRDGTEFWISLSIVPVMDSNGHCTHYISIQRDITERKLGDELIKRRLETLVEERTRDLNMALAKEHELVELKNRFVSIASHEFRTPLSTIIFITDYLLEHYDTLEPKEIKTKLKRVQKQVNHMTFMLEDLLTVGRQQMEIPVSKSKVDLRTFLDKLIEEVEFSTKKTHRIEMDYLCNSINTVETDEKLLRNILINLLSNGIKFSPSKSRIYFMVEESKDNILFEIRDEGVGIPPGDMTNMFTAFYRGSNTEMIQGTGLGLSIVKKAVELLSGIIEVKSELGHGTLFKVVIPKHV